jgi:hypothetical protein
VADRAFFGLVTGQCHHLADLFGGDLRGGPERGTSLSRSPTFRSARSMACNAIQRMRQVRTVSTLTCWLRAICVLFLPSAAAKIIRPRRACCWGVLCRRTSTSNSSCSFSLKVSSCGFGPRIFFLASFVPLAPFYSRTISAALY